MANLKFEIDVSSITSQFLELKKEVETTVKEAAGGLAASTHAKLLELASTELGSLSTKYKDSITFEQLEEGLWIVNLDAKAVWIEDGRKSGFQEELLSGKSSKRNKKGERYAVIPFEHSKPPSQQSTSAKALTDQIRDYLKKNNINYKKIENNADGSPKLGLVKRFNVESAKLKPNHKDSPLQGVSIYQRIDKKTGKVQRDTLTFRIISESMRGTGKWEHPGMQGAHLMIKTLAWAEYEWETKILPAIMEKFNGK